MGECMKTCKRIGEVAVMGVSHGGVRTRDMEATSSESSKRRKVDSREVLQLSLPPHVQLENECRRVVNLPEDSILPAVFGTSEHAPSSLRSSYNSRELVKDSFKTLDLKADLLETEMSSMFSNGGFRETTPSSGLCADNDSSEEMESSQKKPAAASSRRKPLGSKIPSAAEIDDFFSVAEKYEQKRFADKYNYDVVKDVPMEGRYQWVRLKP